MTRASIIDEKLNAILAGRQPAPGDELASELTWMVEQIDNAFPIPVVSDQLEDAHLARMVQAGAAIPVAATATMATVQASLFDRVRAGLSRKVAAATLTLTAAFGGAAYAGVLPAPVQEAVAKAAAMIGLELPNPADEGADRDDRTKDEVGDDLRPADDAQGSGPRGRDDEGSDDDRDEPEGDHDDETDGDDDRDEPDGDESDGEEPDGEEPDGDEPDADEPDGDEPDGDEPDGDETDGDETDGDEPDGEREGDVDTGDGGRKDQSDAPSDDEGTSDE